MNPSRVDRESLVATLRLGTDAAAMLLAPLLGFVAASLVAELMSWTYAGPLKVFTERALPLCLAVAAALCCLFVKGHHHARNPFWEETRVVVGACAFGMLVEAFYIFAFKADASRLALALTWGIAPFIIMAGRLFIRRILPQYFCARVLLVGDDDDLTRAKDIVRSDAYLGYRIVGTSESCDVKKLLCKIRACQADTVVLASDGDTANAALVQRLKESGCNVVLTPRFAGIAASSMQVQYVLGHDAVLLLDRVEVAPRFARMMKRLFDLTVTATALLMLSPLMLVIAILVLRDGGPAIYGHERIGFGGKPFRCLKFRSMATDADARLALLLETDPEAAREWAETQKLKNDPRVTVIGNFLRKTALDELPQLINVLRGEMSLVGPRPVTAEEMDRYGEAACLYTSVRPGVTGLWQVSGRNDVSYEQRVAFDTWYVRNWTPWHDTAIILKTVPALLLRRGAY